MLSDERVRLRPFHRDDIPLKVAWINDPGVHEYLHYEIPLSEDRSRAWWESARRDPSRRDMVIETTDGRPIGLVGLLGIDLQHRLAEIYLAIGEKAHWGQGIGSAATHLLFAWGFDTFDLHKLYATVRAENETMKKLLSKQGMQMEGTMREEKLIAGRRVDIVRMAVLRRDFDRLRQA